MRKRGNNEGSVYQRKDGRWVGAATVGGGRGTQKKKLVYGKTRQEAAAKMADVLKAVKDGGSDAVVLSVDDFADVCSGGAVQLTLDACDVKLPGGAGGGARSR